MATTTNNRKTNELRAYSVARWNGQPFHPDYVWNCGDEYANNLSKLVWSKDVKVIGYSDGKWLLVNGSSKAPVKVVKITKTGWVSMIHQYLIKDENNYVEAGVLVRPNGSTELVQPTIDLL